MSVLERPSLFGSEQDGQHDAQMTSEAWNFDSVPDPSRTFGFDDTTFDDVLDFNFGTDLLMDDDNADEAQTGPVFSHNMGGETHDQPMFGNGTLDINTPWLPSFTSNEMSDNSIYGSAARRMMPQSHAFGEDAMMLDQEADNFLDHHIMQPSLDASFPVNDGLNSNDEAMEDEEEVEDEGSDGDDTEDAITHDYELRPGFRDMGVAFSTWIDKDQSGTYDPNYKAPKQSSKGRRLRGKASTEEQARRARNRERNSDARRICDTQRRLGNSAARVNGCSFVLTLIIPGDRFKAVATKMMDNWPAEEWNNIYVSGDRVVHSGSDADEIPDPSLTKGYRFRGRPSKPLELKRPDISGQPAARGCWNCFENGMLDNKVIMDNDCTQASCSLVHDSTTWPCQTCVADGLECEMITSPTIKSSCERCKLRQIPCSYSTTLNHGESCLECQNIGHRCVAGPHVAAVYRRIALADQAPSSATSQQAGLTCTVCDAAGTRCTLRTEFENSPGRACQACRDTNRACIIAGSPDANGLPTPKHPRRRPKKRKAIAKTVTTGSAEAETANPHPSVATLQTWQTVNGEVLPPGTYLLTKLCHPIAFNHEPSPEQSCHFCALPKYPVLGLGQRLVAVEEDSSGRITPLHPPEYEATRICVGCTSHPMKILICAAHDLRKISTCGADYNFCAAFDRLLDNELLPTDHWCSICPAPASYHCCTLSESFGPEPGCGLMLCELCHTEMTEQHANSLVDLVDALAKKMENEDDARPIGIRADAELLGGNGELAKFLRG